MAAYPVTTEIWMIYSRLRSVFGFNFGKDSQGCQRFVHVVFSLFSGWCKRCRAHAIACGNVDVPSSWKGYPGIPWFQVSELLVHIINCIGVRNICKGSICYVLCSTVH